MFFLLNFRHNLILFLCIIGQILWFLDNNFYYLLLHLNLFARLRLFHLLLHHFLLQFLKIRISKDIFIALACSYLSFFQKNYVIGHFSKFYSMCGHDDCLSFEISFYCILHNKCSYVNINSTQNVIIKIYVTIWIKRTSQIYSKFLPTWKINSIFSDLCVFSICKKF